MGVVELVWGQQRQILVSPGRILNSRGDAGKILLERQIPGVIAIDWKARQHLIRRDELISMDTRHLNGVGCAELSLRGGSARRPSTCFSSAIEAKLERG